MDIYHIWCNLKPGVGDLEFCAAVDRYFGHLSDQGLIHGHRITRTGEVEAFHFGVNSLVTDARFALYRDFPDAVRETGGEKF